MTTRSMLIGASAALAALAPALSAQPPSEPNRDQPVSQPPAERNRDLEPSRRDTGEFLRDCRGLWSLEVQIQDPAVLQRFKAGDTTDRPSGNDDRSRSNDDGNRLNDDRNRSNEDRDRSTDAGAREHTLRGVMDAELILGNSILREEIVLSRDGVEPRASVASPPSREQEAAAMAGAGHLRALCFLSYDPDTRQYSSVFMDNRNGTMRYATGAAEGADRLVLHARPLADIPGYPSAVPPRERTDRTPGDADARPAGHDGMPDYSDVRIVIEKLGRDRQRITVYGAPSTATTWPAQTPATPGAAPEPSTRSSPTAQPTPPTGEFGAIMYRVELTRLSDGDGSRYRSLFERETRRP